MSHYHVSEDPIVMRPVATAIGTSYDASPLAFACNDFNQLILECDLSLATATDVRVQLEEANPARGPQGAYIAPAASDWFTVTVADSASATAAGVIESLVYRQLEIVLPATGRYTLAFPLNYKFVRVKAKTTGGPGATTLKINGIFGKV